jgi:Esterase PHB depolymerase
MWEACTTFRAALCLSLAASVVGTSLANANHDEVPYPPPQTTANKLQPLSNLDRAGITVSGLSSGGFFAHQFHIAYSSLVNGAGIIAGGPFGCVENIPNPYFPFLYVPLDRVSAATASCSHYNRLAWYWLPPAAPRASDSLEFIYKAHAEEVIDDPANISKQRVWLFHGRDDRIVPRSTAEALKEVYAGLGVPADRLQVEWNESGRIANHGMPVAQFLGNSRFPKRDCGEHEEPFVVQCGYEAAESLLRHVYPGAFAPPSQDAHEDGTVVAFDQSEFFTRPASTISMHNVGYLYVPHACREEQCRLHVAFHGCRQDMETIHDDFVRDAGYNRWAATNNIVVLYPQTAASTSNPQGCWDFWGYTGPSDYYGKNGSQMRAVKAMVDRLLSREP